MSIMDTITSLIAILICGLLFWIALAAIWLVLSYIESKLG